MKPSKTFLYEKKHWDASTKIDREWDPQFRKFVRRSKRMKKVTELFVKPEHFEGNKVKKEPDLTAKKSKLHQSNIARSSQVNRVISIKREFTEGDIVSVGGRYLGLEDLENVTHQPIFHGTVESLLRYDMEEVKDVGEDQSHVHVVLSENCEWKHKDEYNAKRFIIDDEFLTVEVPIPINPN